MVNGLHVLFMIVGVGLGYAWARAVWKQKQEMSAALLKRKMDAMQATLDEVEDTLLIRWWSNEREAVTDEAR